MTCTRREMVGTWGGGTIYMSLGDMNVHMHLSVCVRAHIHSYIYPYIHTYKATYLNPCMYAYIHIHTGLHMRMRVN